MARWPRSSLYFAGTVQDFNDIEYLVRFDDEDQSELAIKFKDVEVGGRRPGSAFRACKAVEALVNGLIWDRSEEGICRRAKVPKGAAVGVDLSTCRVFF